MKILLVSKSFTRGGSASGATNLGRALAAAGAEVVCCDAYATQRGTLLGGARLVERVLERLLYDAETHCLRFAPPVFSLPALASRHRPDIIQLCDLSGNVIRFADLAGVNCPVVHRMSDFWPYHGPAHYAAAPKQGSTRLARWLLRRAIYSGEHLPTARVAPSHWLANLLAKNSPDRSPLRVIRNAVTIPKMITPTRTLPGGLRFGFVANQVSAPRKGLAKLFPLLQALQRRGVEVSLQVYGRVGGGRKKEYTGVAVNYLGEFDRHNLAGVYADFDILLCPSRLDNSPNVVSEALAHGRPVIGQQGTGMESYITEDTGAMVDFWSPPRSGGPEFVESCLQIQAALPRYSAAAREYAVTCLAPRVIGKAYLQLYRELLGGPGNK